MRIYREKHSIQPITSTALTRFYRIGRSLIEPINVIELLRRTELLSKPRLPSNVRMEVDVDPIIENRLVLVDKEQLIGVMLELIKNAANALRARADGIITLKVEQKNDKIAISVMDNGPGIPQDIRGKILEEQLPSKTGLGLGLFLINKIINALGGELIIDTSSAVGTVITILLPIATQ